MTFEMQTPEASTAAMLGMIQSIYGGCPDVPDVQSPGITGCGSSKTQVEANPWPAAVRDESGDGQAGETGAHCLEANLSSNGQQASVHYETNTAMVEAATGVFSFTEAVVCDGDGRKDDKGNRDDSEEEEEEARDSLSRSMDIRMAVRQQLQVGGRWVDHQTAAPYLCHSQGNCHPLRMSPKFMTWISIMAFAISYCKVHDFDKCYGICNIILYDEHMIHTSGSCNWHSNMTQCIESAYCTLQDRNWTQAKTSAFSAMLKYACLGGSLAGSFAKLLSPLI
jgi:hypothetical protein